MYFKEWFEKKIRKTQIPKGEKEETDNNNISPSSNTVFKKKEANKETGLHSLSEDDDNNTIALHHNSTIPEATKFQSISPKEETKELLEGAKVDMQLMQQQDHQQQQDYNADDVLTILNHLPEHWIGKEMKLRIIANRRDATWITKRGFRRCGEGIDKC